MNDRNVRMARPRDARKILDDGKPRQATQAELRDAMALLAKHALRLREVSTAHLEKEDFDFALDAESCSGMYASAALVLAAAIEKEFTR